MSSLEKVDRHDSGSSTSRQSKPPELLARVFYEKDKVVFSEGGDGTDAYIVESGRVGISKTVSGKPVRLAVLEKGAVFGEMAAITGELRSATATALEPLVLIRVTKATIQQHVAGCDPFIRALIAILINNITRVNDRYANTHTVAGKLILELKAAQTAKGN